MSDLVDVPRRVSFPAQEETILEFWKEIDAFATSLEMNKDLPAYSFYDGPPFATGLPHYGHILAGTIKDIVTRYAHQTGHHVERRFGWDCHGLPIEFEIEKQLGLKTKQQVLDFGISNYNDACRKIVMRYSGEWETIVGRLGRWIDFQNDYKTMSVSFMESVWWVFSQLYVKGLVYRGFKVMPYSTACTTPLSNFEVQQNYKDTTDPSITVAFPVVDDPQNASLLAWTTTPWTLPSNLALCVREDLLYCKFKHLETGNVYYACKSRLPFLYPQLKKNPELMETNTLLEIISECRGADLVGLKYVPLFDYFVDKYGPSGAFRVVCDDYVTDDSGTGIVHQAPAFGEDDFRIGLKNGIIQKDGDIACPIDENGSFVEPVHDFVGLYVKDADKSIIANIRQRGRLFKLESITHSYPFCWRSDTPLIYKAVSSWFVRVEEIRDRLLACNAQTYWVPDHVKENRFANWLVGARDWAISRTRYWGCPIPIWISDDGEEVVVVGSVDELEELTGVRVNDLHRENIDDLVIPSKMGKGDLHRILDVFDCWFESGSMPYAQQHYPFENKQTFLDSFPADFIAEGLDQTRGWFYTLMVLGTALFDKPPFKNLIVNGLVLAEDGKKMSKRLKNYPDPMTVVNQFGADALRLYLINSPVVRAEPLKFSEAGVGEVVKTIFLPWFNAYRFFVQNAKRFDTTVEGGLFSSVDAAAVHSPNIMDRFALSSSQSLVKFVRQEMEGYRLYTVIPKLLNFVDCLTNWYVRLNRRRLKGEDGEEEWMNALTTLYRVLVTSALTMAPFTPFLSEAMWMNLKLLVPEEVRMDSVHYLPFAEFDESLVDLNVELAVSKMQQIVVAGRRLRDQKKIGVKFPVPQYVVLSLKDDFFEGMDALLPYIREELNAKEIVFRTDVPSFYTFTATPNRRRLGRRLRSKMRPVTQALKELGHTQIIDFLETGEMTILEEKLDSEDITLGSEFTGDAARFSSSPVGAYDTAWVVVDSVIPPELLREGYVRVLVSKIQQLRKMLDMEVEDKVDVSFLFHMDCDEREAVSLNGDMLAECLRPFMTYRLLQSREELTEEPYAAQKIKVKGEERFTIFFVMRE